MNYRLVINRLGLLFVVLSITQLVTALWAAGQLAAGHEGESQALWSLLMSAGLALVAGGIMWLTTRGGPPSLGRREALLLVAASWLIGAALAGAPFCIWARLMPADAPDHILGSPVNAYFEAMSGLTTTGATVIVGIPDVPRSLLLWRATTHWLGGLGIVVLFVAVLPSIGVGGKRLFRVEAPGPEPEGVHPHIRETARILWLIYLGLTVAEVIALRLAGMSWYDAVCHTFATLATGGFSTVDTSVGGFSQLAVTIIITVFMVLAGVNFGLYYQLMRGRIGSVWRDAELRTYLAILFVGCAIVVISIINEPIVLTTGEQLEPSVGAAIRHGVFTTVSIQTTTGFCTADFNKWSFIPKATLILLMFVGASAGSTGGGIKVIRVLVAFKIMVAELERAFRPNVVRAVRVGQIAVSPELRLATIAFVLGHLLLFGAGAALMMVFEQSQGISVTTAASASVATLCNIGPGLGAVGAVENYAWFGPLSKITMSLLMALGRLEVFAILVLFVPRFWRST